METSLPAHLHIVAWPDPVIDRLGFPPQSPYSEICWLPRLGSAATLAYRRLAGTLAHRPDGFDIDVVELAQSLGLGTGTGAHAPVSRTLRRLTSFELARFVDDATFGLRRRIPPLSDPPARSPQRRPAAHPPRTAPAPPGRHRLGPGQLRLSQHWDRR